MPVTPLDPRTDGRTSPLGIGSARPELRWLDDPDGGASEAWEVQVATSDSFGTETLVWATGRVEGARPTSVEYGGSDLMSATHYWWRVRSWPTASGTPTPWAESTFSTGLFSTDDWQAEWIAGPARGPKDAPTPAYFRGVARIGSPVRSAQAFVSSLGWHRLIVNDVDMTGPALVPRWTALDKEVEYVTYDVTEAMQAGLNVMQVVVGDGRFRGSNGYENHSRVYGDRLAALVQVHVELADGTLLVITSDSTWTASGGRILESDPKTGERVDLTVTQEAASSPATIVENSRHLVAESAERVTQVAELRPASITRTRAGAQIVDFGQNFAGVVRLRLRGQAGTTVTLTHSEVLAGDGSLDIDYIHLSPFGRWYQRDSVVLSGEDVEWQPWFTIHGFRYVEITGLSSPLVEEDVTGVVISSELRQTGSFTSSNEQLNRLWRNVEWSLRSNFMDTSTDCPTRERSGWTGDNQVFAPTATAFVEAQQFLRRYLHTLELEQREDGTIPAVIPSGFSAFSGGPHGHLKDATTAAGWSDASVLVPWTLYEYYGDTKVLADQYASARAWVEECRRRAREGTSRARRRDRRRAPAVEEFIVDTGWQFGEWMRPGESAIGSAIDGRRRGAVVATAYFEHSARLLSLTAGVLGRSADEEEYRALADDVRRAWRAAFLRPDGLIGTDRQDDYVRALAFDLLEPDEETAAVDRLVALIDKAGGHLGTGFLSTPLLLDALVRGGRADVAWSVLMQRSSPSWLHQVDRGATTVWESWEGYTRSGKAKMSHNHFAFGSVARFLVEHIAGITPAAPGYAVIGLRPLVGGDLEHASARIGTPFGEVSLAWQMDAGDVLFDVVIPPGTTAEFLFGTSEPMEVLTSGSHTLRRPL